MRSTLSTLALLLLLTIPSGAQSGVWSPVPFSPSTFTAPGGAWLVSEAQQVTYAYSLTGNTLTVSLVIHLAEVREQPDYLEVRLPHGWTIARKMAAPALVADGLGPTLGALYAEPGETRLRVARAGLGRFSPGPSIIEGQITLEIR